MTRRSWGDLPVELRGRIAERIGDRVVSATSLTGGFSPGMTSVLTCAQGDQVFVKAVSARANSYSPVLYRREARLHALLPDDAPAPRLLWSMDHDDWAVLAFERLPGSSPEVPWKARELQAVLDVTRRLPRAVGRSARLPSVAELFREELVGWRELAGRSASPPLHPWISSRLADLVGLEEQWEEAAEGHQLVHGDLRADNTLLVNGEAMLVDWAYACRGSALFDIVLLLLGAVAQGGQDPAGVLRGSGRLRRGEHDAAFVLLATFTGWFTWLGSLPPVPGLPTLRPFQDRMAAAGRRCLRAAWT